VHEALAVRVPLAGELMADAERLPGRGREVEIRRPRAPRGRPPGPRRRACPPPGRTRT
jgi:hypothetical protein